MNHLTAFSLISTCMLYKQCKKVKYFTQGFYIAGQNKNRYVLGYFMWRVMTGQHRLIEYHMQVPGMYKHYITEKYFNIVSNYFLKSFFLPFFNSIPLLISEGVIRAEIFKNTYNYVLSHFNN